VIELLYIKLEMREHAPVWKLSFFSVSWLKMDKLRRQTLTAQCYFRKILGKGFHRTSLYHKI